MDASRLTSMASAGDLFKIDASALHATLVSITNVVSGACARLDKMDAKLGDISDRVSAVDAATKTALADAARVERSVRTLEGKQRAELESVEQRLRAYLDGIEEKYDAKLEARAKSVTDGYTARFEQVDRRLTTIAATADASAIKVDGMAGRIDSTTSSVVSLTTRVDQLIGAARRDQEATAVIRSTVDSLSDDVRVGAAKVMELSAQHAKALAAAAEQSAAVSEAQSAAEKRAIEYEESIIERLARVDSELTAAKGAVTSAAAAAAKSAEDVRGAYDAARRVEEKTAVMLHSVGVGLADGPAASAAAAAADPSSVTLPNACGALVGGARALAKRVADVEAKASAVSVAVGMGDEGGSEGGGDGASPIGRGGLSRRTKVLEGKVEELIGIAERAADAASRTDTAAHYGAVVSRVVGERVVQMRADLYALWRLLGVPSDCAAAVASVAHGVKLPLLSTPRADVATVAASALDEPPVAGEWTDDDCVASAHSGAAFSPLVRQVIYLRQLLEGVAVRVDAPAEDRVTRGMLGVVLSAAAPVASLTGDVAEDDESATVGMTPGTVRVPSGAIGVRVVAVRDGGPADAAGIGLNDVILSVAGRPCTARASLVLALKERGRGSCNVRVYRATHNDEVTVTVYLHEAGSAPTGSYSGATDAASPRSSHHPHASTMRSASADPVDTSRRSPRGASQPTVRISGRAHTRHIDNDDRIPLREGSVRDAGSVSDRVPRSQAPSQSEVGGTKGRFDAHRLHPRGTRDSSADPHTGATSGSEAPRKKVDASASMRPARVDASTPRSTAVGGATREPRPSVLQNRPYHGVMLPTPSRTPSR